MDASQHMVDQYADEAFILYGEGELSPSATKKAKKRLKHKKSTASYWSQHDWIS